MRSFAIVAGLAAAVNAAAAYYPAESSSVAAYPATSEYSAYPADSTPAAYPESSKAPEYPEYPAESSMTPEYSAYPESSKAPEYPAYSSAPAYTTTSVVKGLTTVCPEATTVTYGSKTYTVSQSTTLIDDDNEYTTTYVVKPTPTPVMTPVYSEYSSVPAGVSSAVPYYPVASKPAGGNGTTAYPTAGKPSASSTKPATPEFTGAASRAAASVLVIAGALAALL